MTYFETPADKSAWIHGMSTERWEAIQEDAAEAEADAEHSDPERFVSEEDYFALTPAEVEQLEAALDAAEFEGFHA